MRFLSTFVLLATLSVFVEAASFNHNHVHRSNHNRVSRRADGTRCRQRPNSANNTSTYSGSNGNNTNSNDSNSDNQSNNDSSKSDPASNASNLINVQDSTCGPSGATSQVTQTTGPNGAIDWMNCGINTDGGWNPPHVEVSELIAVELQDAISQDGPYSNCAAYDWAFEQFGIQYGLPPILLAAIALQESSCNPSTVGPNGEQGLMQLTPDKCGNAPGGNCQDVGYNIATGAQYFDSLLSANGGSFFLALGTYNGWVKGMTVEYATRLHDTACHAQNNLDYLCRLCNGWLQGQDPSVMHIGKYFNLDSC